MKGPSVPPVLLFGAGLTALGVIRALGREGIPATVVGGASDFVARSRWYRKAPGEAPAECSVSALNEYLDSLSLESAVLVGTSDDWVRCLSRLDAVRSQRFCTSLPDCDLVARLLDKGGLAEALRNAGVPHPRTAVLESVEQLQDIPDDLLSGAFLKPADSQLFSERFHLKALSIDSRDDAVHKLRALEADGIPMLLQEYIPGPSDRHYFVDGFVDRAGVVRAMFARRRIRMYPLDYGNSSYVVSVPPEEAAGAVEAVERLMSHVRYRGIFSAEFKLDPRDDLFKLLEVNVRPWWYVEFAQRCGVNVCTMYYRDALGHEVPPVTSYRRGEGLVYAWCDFKAWRAGRRAGKTSGGQWLRQWIGSQRPIFAWDDPLPACSQGLSYLRQKLGRLLSPRSATSGLPTVR